jgi:hypothetical protein
MKTLIIMGSSNTPGRKDYTGAFLPEATAYQKVHGQADDIIHFDNQLPFSKRYADLAKKLHQLPTQFYDRIVVFCHGWADGIQAGVTRKSVSKLLTEFEDLYTDGALHVVLFCCSTGDDDDDDDEQGAGTQLRDDGNLGEGSFADVWRDELCKHGSTNCRVVAHRTAGHTTKNPNVIIFDGNFSPTGGIGGVMPISPAGDKKLWRTWVQMLKTDFRFRFPYMTTVEIRNAVAQQAAKK